MDLTKAFDKVLHIKGKYSSLRLIPTFLVLQSPKFRLRLRGTLRRLGVNRLQLRVGRHAHLVHLLVRLSRVYGKIAEGTLAQTPPLQIGMTATGRNVWSWGHRLISLGGYVALGRRGGAWVAVATKERGVVLRRIGGFLSGQRQVGHRENFVGWWCSA